MDTVGIGFKLNADATQFEKEILKMRRGVSDAENQVKGFGKVMQSIGKATGFFLLYKTLNDAANAGRRLKEESAQLGKALGPAQQALVAYSDMWISVTDRVKALPTEVVGGLAILGQEMGTFVAKLTMGAEQFEIYKQQLASEAAAQRAINELAAARSLHYQKALKDLEKINAEHAEAVKILRELRKDEDADWMAKLSAEDRLRILLSIQAEQQKDLAKSGRTIAEQARLEGDYKKNNQQIDAARTEIAQRHARITEETNEKLVKQEKELLELAQKRATAEQKVAAARNALSKAKTDASKPGLQKLANVSKFQSGISMDMINAGQTARDVIGIDAEMKAAREAGDTAKFEELSGKRRGLTQGISQFLTDEEANPFGDLEQNLTDAMAEQDALGSPKASLAQRVSGATKNLSDQVGASVQGGAAAGVGGNDIGSKLDHIKSAVEDVNKTLSGKFVNQS